MTELKRLEIAHDEWTAWQRVVKLLLETGAVTLEDCEYGVLANPQTKGQELFSAIRTWGNRLIELERSRKVGTIPEGEN